MKTLLALFTATLTLALTPPARAQAAPAPIPAFQKDAVILFQGDSITDGNRGRSPDPNHILGHGYQFIIAAQFGAAFPEKNLTFINKGVSGNTVDNLQKRWQTDTLDLKPTILSILIGVNDNSTKMPFDHFEQTYDQLLADARAANPDLKLVLCAPFTLPAKRNEGNTTWFTDIKQRQDIVEKLAKKYHAALVKFQPVFDAAAQKAPAEYWIWDGVHPTYSGHQLMADEWIKTVRAFWP